MSVGIIIIASVIYFCGIAILDNALDVVFKCHLNKHGTNYIRPILKSLVIIVSGILVVCAFNYDSVKHLSLSLKYGSSNVISITETGSTVSDIIQKYADKNKWKLLYVTTEGCCRHRQVTLYYLVNNEKIDSHENAKKDSLSNRYNQLTK